jgi:IstB-like ATP binding protein
VIAQIGDRDRSEATLGAPTVLETAAQKQLPYADFLADLLATETTTRRERYLRARTRLAHLRFQRTLARFMREE